MPATLPPADSPTTPATTTDTTSPPTPTAAGSPADRSGAVTVAYIHHNEVAYSWHHSMVQLLVTDLRNHQRIRRGGFIGMRCSQSGYLPHARNKAVRQFLAEGKADWLCWIDTDMGFPADMVEQLIAAADPVERPIVGALCFSQREIQPDGMGGWHTLPTPTIFDWVNEDGIASFEIRFSYPGNALVRVGGTGAAAILIHRSAFEKIAAKYGQTWYDRIPAGDSSIGEDLSFCVRATAVGLPIYVHTGVRTTHAKTIWLSEHHYLDASKAEPATEQVAVIVPVLGRPEHAEPFMTSLRASTGLATAYAVCDDHDTAAITAWEQAGAEVLIAPPKWDPDTRERRPGTFAEKVNFAYHKTRQPWLLLVGSDVHFHPGWLDQALAAAGDRFHVIGTNDLANPRVLSGGHATHPLIRRSYIDEQGASWDGPGVVAHEGYRHWFVDDEIVTVAKQRNVWVPALASIVEHVHPIAGKAPTDPVYALGAASAEADRKLYSKRLERFAPTS